LFREEGEAGGKQTALSTTGGALQTKGFKGQRVLATRLFFGRGTGHAKGAGWAHGGLPGGLNPRQQKKHQPFGGGIGQAPGSVQRGISPGAVGVPKKGGQHGGEGQENFTEMNGDGKTGDLKNFGGGPGFFGPNGAPGEGYWTGLGGKWFGRGGVLEGGGPGAGSEGGAWGSGQKNKGGTYGTGAG